MTLDLGIHLSEVVAIVFWIGVSWGDLRWIKGELLYLRNRFDGYLNREDRQQ